MNKLQSKISFLLSVILIVFLVLSCCKIEEMISSKDKSTKEETTKEETTKESTKDITTGETAYNEEDGVLYFCEDYLQKEEINKGSRFSTGRLTVMVKTKTQIYDRDVSLKIEKINDDGTKKFIRTINFTIPIGDYFFFKHKQLNFETPGLYRVTMIAKDKSPVCSGEVTIIP